MYNTPQDNIFSIKDSGIHKEKLVINMEVGFTMDITKEILRRATIQGITEYLLYGSAIEAKQTELDYNKKLEESYSKNEEVLREHGNKTVSELIDSANEMASEVSEVYTALGLQAGMKIMQELLKGMNKSQISLFVYIQKQCLAGCPEQRLLTGWWGIGASVTLTEYYGFFLFDNPSI